MRSLKVLVLLAGVSSLLSACRTDPKNTDTGKIGGLCHWYLDGDSDGYGDPDNSVEDVCYEAPEGYVENRDDCDDHRPAVNPAAAEICDDIDDDCDGLIDEDLSVTWYTDSDGDGYGDPLTGIEDCAVQKGLVGNGNDCDDTNAEIYPDAPERCDGLDNDCDGTIDEDLVYAWYADVDGDGFGDPGVFSDSCDPGMGWVTDSTDCDDYDLTINPDALEICDEQDNDCDSLIDEDLLTTFYQDSDRDGYGNADISADLCEMEPGWVSDITDCDDGNSSINPGAPEICDGMENDCDGLTDDEDPDLIGATTWYQDLDEDDFGNDLVSVTSCLAPDGYTRFPDDCNDTDPAFHPGAEERDCTDPNDYNCDGVVGYVDSDKDGFAACEECNDGNAAVFPGATESCNGIDDDCDTVVDEPDSVDASTWYQDLDLDSYGNAASASVSCYGGVGWVLDATDCDDERAEVNPARTELCDGLDNDCNGAIDDGVGTLWYLDTDGDGFGDSESTLLSCELPWGYTSDATDCDDSHFDINPGAEEYCDGLDNDCDSVTDEPDAEDASTWYRDRDEDSWGDTLTTTVACDAPFGYVSGLGDCNDRNNTINPGATEACDYIDNDCDGEIDEEGAADGTIWYLDLDDDGYGDPDVSLTSCEGPDGYVRDGSDCEDLVAAIHPGVTELCDEIDNDCDGLIDDLDPGVTGTLTWYQDADGDLYGNDSVTTLACVEPGGYVDIAGDCNDADTAYNPAASETDCTDPNDYNCDGLVGYADTDGDGWAACEECDDRDPNVFPGATELCNDADDDCDGVVDEDDATDALTWHQDADSDGYGSATVTRRACDASPGWIADSSDCDDAHATAHPGMIESCDGLDNDCDGSVDESGGSTWYQDNDNDTFGDYSISLVACTAPTGYVASSTDCDDSDDSVYPLADEHCNDIDDDCDGTIDESDAVDMSTFYRDRDEDSYGDATVTTTACTAPTGYTAATGDCNDRNDAIHPGVDELCDRVDNDCDGTIDENDATDAHTWYADTDSDGYGDPSADMAACTAPSGYVALSTDCDDSDAAIRPGATETCDDQDNDCDGMVDDADHSVSGTTTWYRDTDGDHYGSAHSTTSACDAPDGYVAEGGDCNDSNTSYYPGAPEDDCTDPRDYNCDGVTGYRDMDSDGYAACEECDDTDASNHPGATERCDGEDNDCDGTVDETGATGSLTFYQDADGDGYGNLSVTTSTCTAEAGWVSNSLDCDDTNASIRPTGSEVCDGRDNDCDGNIDEYVTTTYYLDSDLDGFGSASATIAACALPVGYSSLSTDCDDSAVATYPGAPEYCDAIDNDCDGTTDETGAVDAATWYQDRDGDHYGDSTSTIRACTLPSGYAATSDDCNDRNSGINPGAEELCDTVDNDCDGANNESGAIGEATWYADADSDGFGSTTVSVTACSSPSGYTSDHTDCNDANDTAWPGAVEYCDLVDNDCDGTTDESSAADADTWYADSDRDGYGNPVSTRLGCTVPSGYVADNTDCDDRFAAANPAATEYCDLIDNDCDSSIDESSAADATTWYRDSDTDGYGDPSTTQRACYLPTGYVANSADCNDSSSVANPAATEACDGIDNDCDSSVDEGEATGSTNWYADADHDGYGSTSSYVRACSAPAGYLSDHSDCDDSDLSVNPAATESCDYDDNDCDGVVDDGYKVLGKYVLDTDCGSCGNDCATWTYDNAESWCRGTAITPYCDYTCNDGWFDTDLVSINGCECEYVSAFDAPFDGLDDDCDGLDGDHATAIHVSASTGSATGDGSLEDPITSIQDGIDLAETRGLSYVIVAQGTYREAVTLAEGVNLFGGYSTDYAEHDPDVYATFIDVTSSTEPAVSAVDIASDTHFDGFTVIARARTSGSRGAIGLWIEDCTSSLHVTNNWIEAMDASDGVDGDAGDEGSNGTDGSDGVVGGYALCTALPDGGPGGINTCGGVVVEGGDGGGAVCPGSGTSQEDGQSGFPSGSGGLGGEGGCDGLISSSSCGLCNIDDCWDPGEEGGSGVSGTYGAGGTGSTDTDGSLSGFSWWAGYGTAGGTGAYGTGGGGGGAGSGAYVASSCGSSHLGGTGGGGGAGGCGGLAGNPGTGGGGSIGVLFNYSSSSSDLPLFSGNSIVSNDAGYGGDGGNGGLGGVGGLGGLGGNSARSTAWCGNTGGEGGPGGNGGGGGGGGGGAGGISYAAFAVGLSPSATYLSTDNMLDHGRGGEGGRGGLAGSVPGEAGTDGANGPEGEQNW